MEEKQKKEEKKKPSVAKKVVNAFIMGALLLAGLASAAIVVQLAVSLVAGGTVSAPFTALITAASVGTVAGDGLSVSGANTVAGSNYETISTSITNNANQPISAFLQYSCSSSDNSLTSNYIDVRFDGVNAQHKCDASNKVYAYRTFNAETFAASTTTTPTVEYRFPITSNGYYVGDYTCAVDVVVAKAC